jgi:hypothetical protein
MSSLCAVGSVRDKHALHSVLRAVLRRMVDALERVLLRSGYTRRFDMTNSKTHVMLIDELQACFVFSLYCLPLRVSLTVAGSLW